MATSTLSVNRFMVVDWTIADFLSTRSKGAILSSIFKYKDYKLFIRGYPESIDNINYWSLSLLKNDNKIFPGKYTLGIKRPDGSVFRSFQHKLSEQNPPFMRYLDVLEEKYVLDSDGSLTAFCSLNLDDDPDHDEKETRAILENISKKLSHETFGTFIQSVLSTTCNTDVQFVVNNKTILAHRFVLATKSPVFATMFVHDMVEKNSGVIEITDFDADCVQAFVTFLYNGQVEYKNDPELFKMAHKYCVQDLKDECRRIMLRKLDEKSVCNIMLLAFTYDDFYLLKTCVEYFVSHYGAVIQTDECKNFILENPTFGSKLPILVMTYYNNNNDFRNASDIKSFF